MAAKIRACMVDMDGTLVDSMPYWKQAEQAVCAALGVQLPPDDGYRLHLVCDPQMVSERAGKDVEALWGLITEHMTAAYDAHIQPKPGAVEYLQALRARGIPVWLVTGSALRNANAVLDRCGLAPLFDCVISTRGKALRKDAPAFFERLAEEMGTETYALLVLEDDVRFSRAAKAAGCVVYGIHDPSHGAREVMQAQCDAFAESFADLPTAP